MQLPSIWKGVAVPAFVLPGTACLEAVVEGMMEQMESVAYGEIYKYHC